MTKIFLEWSLEDILMDVRKRNLRITKEQAQNVLFSLASKRDEGVSWELMSQQIDMELAGKLPLFKAPLNRALLAALTMLMDNIVPDENAYPWHQNPCYLHLAIQGVEHGYISRISPTDLIWTDIGSNLAKDLRA